MYDYSLVFQSQTELRLQTPIGIYTKKRFCSTAALLHIHRSNCECMYCRTIAAKQSFFHRQCVCIAFAVAHKQTHTCENARTLICRSHEILCVYSSYYFYSSYNRRVRLHRFSFRQFEICKRIFSVYYSILRFFWLENILFCSFDRWIFGF